MSDFDIASYVSHIEANRSVKDALMQSLKTRRPPYRISVTDLLNLKQAYFKRKYGGRRVFRLCIKASLTERFASMWET